MIKKKMSTKLNLKNREFTFSKLFPNMVTIVAICFGLTSIRYAIDDKLEIATSLVIVAGLLDVVDGRLARYLKATSIFGAQLDSLADFIDFGVAPGIIIYLWKLQEIPIQGLGWAIIVFFSICCVIRLARFNSDINNEEMKEFSNNYFLGVPAPMGAYIVGMPMMIEFNPYYDFRFNCYFVGAYTMLAALLMVSRLPTLSAKKFSVKPHNVNFIFAFFTIIIALLIMEPWFVLPLIGLGYLASIPITSYLHYKREHEQSISN